MSSREAPQLGWCVLAPGRLAPIRPGATRGRSAKPTHLLHLAWFVVPGNSSRRPRISSGCASFELMQEFARGRQARHRLGFGLRIRLELWLLLRTADPAVPNTVYGAASRR